MRAPRKAKYLWSYAGHVLQGVVLGVVLGFLMAVALVVLYLAYQRIEYSRFKDRVATETAGRRLLDDWPSRDIADFMLGGWIGMWLGLSWQGYLLFYLITSM